MVPHSHFFASATISPSPVSATMVTVHEISATPLGSRKFRFATIHEASRTAMSRPHQYGAIMASSTNAMNRIQRTGCDLRRSMSAKDRSDGSMDAVGCLETSTVSTTPSTTSVALLRSF